MKTYRAIVVMSTDKGVTVKVPMQYGQMYYDLGVVDGTPASFVAGDRVIIQQVSNDNDDFLVTGFDGNKESTDHTDGGSMTGQVINVNGNTWQLVNARWDKETSEFYRIEKTRPAYAIVARGGKPVSPPLSYSDEGIITWVAQPAAYSIIRVGGLTTNSRFGGVGGWEKASTIGSNRNVAFAKDVDVAGKLKGTDLATFLNGLSVTGTAAVLGSISASLNGTFGGTLGVTGAATFNSTLSVIGNAGINGSLRVAGEANLGGAASGQWTQIDGNVMQSFNGSTQTSMTIMQPVVTDAGMATGANAILNKKAIDKLGDPNGIGIPVLTGAVNLTVLRGLSTGYYIVSNGVTSGLPLGITYAILHVMRYLTDGEVRLYARPSGRTFTTAWNSATTVLSWREDISVAEETTGAGNLNDRTATGVYMYLVDANIASGGSNFPVNAAGMLEVHRNTDGTGGFIYQRYTAYRNYATHIYVRSFYGGTWGDWNRIGQGSCSGRITLALPTQGTVNQASVSFPTNRYSVNPAVSVAPWTTVPQNCAVSFSTLTTTSFMIHGVRTVGTGDLNITWMAMNFGA